MDASIVVAHPTDALVAIVPHSEAADQTITIRDLDRNAVVATLAGSTSFIEDLAFNRDGSRIATASGDGSIGVWDAASGVQQLALTGHLGHVHSATFSPDDRRLASHGVDGTVRVWALDLEELAEIARRRVTRELTDAECQRYLRRDRCGT